MHCLRSSAPIVINRMMGIEMNERAREPSSADGIAWDLGDLYDGMDDPALRADLETAEQRANHFERKYRGTVFSEEGTPSAKLLEALADYEAILEQVGRAVAYVHLLHAAQSDDPKRGALLQSVRERSTAIRKHLIFFELEWLDVPDGAAEVLLGRPEISRYRHYLEKERKLRPHRLSEPEEKILDEKANTGSRAFVRLFDETLSAARFKVSCDGEVKEMNEQQVLALLYHPDRSQRAAASEGFTEGLRSYRQLLTYIFNVVVLDHKVDDGLRSFPTPMASRNLSNEIDQEVVDTLLAASESGHDIVQRYYRFKARLLGVDRLFDYDRYAPTFADAPSYDWTRCRQIVEAAYADFDGRAGEIVGAFFRKSWIDADPRLGKRGGAFCSSTVPSVHPYVLVNYTDRMRDVMTVAHELGHGIHQSLASERGYLQCDAPLTLAETASVFGEMLVFHRLMELETDPEVRLSLLCGKLEDAFATAFRQVVLTRFEQKLHAARREEGELSTERIGDLWMQANRPMHGDAVELTENYSLWWIYIPHFIHTRFYCYAYAFGELLVLALYQKYREEGRAFVPRYFSLLAAGGSEVPDVLLKEMGVDITDAGFFAGGLTVLRELLEEAEALGEALHKS